MRSRIDPARRLTGELSAAADWRRELEPATLDRETREARALLSKMLELAATRSRRHADRSRRVHGARRAGARDRSRHAALARGGATSGARGGCRSGRPSGGGGVVGGDGAGRRPRPARCSPPRGAGHARAGRAAARVGARGTAMTRALRALAVLLAIAALIDPAFAGRRSRPASVDIRAEPSHAGGRDPDSSGRGSAERDRRRTSASRPPRSW